MKTIKFEQRPYILNDLAKAPTIEDFDSKCVEFLDNFHTLNVLGDKFGIKGLITLYDWKCDALYIDVLDNVHTDFNELLNKFNVEYGFGIPDVVRYVGIVFVDTPCMDDTKSIHQLIKVPKYISSDDAHKCIAIQDASFEAVDHSDEYLMTIATFNELAEMEPASAECLDCLLEDNTHVLECQKACPVGPVNVAKVSVIDYSFCYDDDIGYSIAGDNDD